MKICVGKLIKHVWRGGVYSPKMNIKKRLEALGLDTSAHNFLFLHLAVYNNEAVLAVATMKPAAK